MTEETTKNLELLKRKMGQEIKPILFTGAGFTYKAKNVHGQEMPLGSELKKSILTDLLGFDENSDEYNKLMTYGLDDVYGYAKNLNDAQAIAFLVDLFSGVQPEDHHRAIIDFPWHKIYTVNIDDLIENILTPREINVLNSSSMIPSRHKGRIEYIKLHGCVRNRDGGFVFSKTEYYSKINSHLDWRYTRLIEDLQTRDVVFIGTSDNELDISLYLLKYGVSKDSGHGNFYIVNPSPDFIQKDTIQKSGAHLIQLSTKEFAEWMRESIIQEERTSRQIEKQQFLLNFRDVGKYIKAHSKTDNSSTRLYMGDSPTWLDVTKGYDFRTPSAAEITDMIQNLIASSRENVIFTLLSKAIGGKSVHLKQIGMNLLMNGYDVYEFIGTEFRSSDFLAHAANHNETTVLLVDNASGYYATIARILEKYPTDKRLIVVTTARPYFHYKKYYDLRHFNTYTCFDIDSCQNAEYFAAVGKSAVETLKGKGLLGDLRQLNDEDRVKEFVKHKDIPEVLWRLFNGGEMRKRLLKTYSDTLKQISADDDLTMKCQMKDLLLALAIFHDRELSNIPDTLLFLWLGNNKERVVKRLGDIIKLSENNGIAIRSNIYVKNIIANAKAEDKLRVIATVLKKISPYIVGPRESYWHHIQARLMNGTYLQKNLNIPPKKVRSLFTSLLHYYENDANYFLQLGRVEQSLGQYEIAYNHFRQAEFLAPDYYNVRNAIARNFLLQSYKDAKLDKTTAAENYAIGYREMYKLIEEKEQYQVRAYSIHSLVVESVNYWRKWDIKPSKDELKEILMKLREALDDFPDDNRMKHACKILYSFISKYKLNNIISGNDNFPLRFRKAATEVVVIEQDYDDQPD